MSVIKVFWKLHAATLNTASVRYRCIIPMYESKICDPTLFEHDVQGGDCLEELSYVPDYLIFVKSYFESDLQLMSWALKQNIKVILDVCDNIPVSTKDVAVRERFAKMFLRAEKVIVPTEVLRQELVSHFGEESSSKLHVIPDPIESPEHLAFGMELFKTCRMQKNLLKNKRWKLMIWIMIKRFFKKMLSVPYKIYLFLCFFIFAKKRVQSILNVDKAEIQMPFVYKAVLFPYMIFYYAFRLVTLKKIPIRFGFAYNFVKSTYREYEAFQDKFNLRRAWVWLKNKYFSRVGISLINNKSADVSRFLWFGNAGKYGIFGMSDLLLLKDDLQKIAAERRVELIIISNSFDLFLKIERELRIPCRYINWNLTIVYEVLKFVDVTLIPNPLNKYTLTKSSNRTLMSLYSQVPVVATRTLELEGFADCLLFEDWYSSIKRYLDDNDFRQRHLHNAKAQLMRSAHNSKHVWGLWRKQLQVGPAVDS